MLEPCRLSGLGLAGRRQGVAFGVRAVLRWLATGIEMGARLPYGVQPDVAGDEWAVEGFLVARHGGKNAFGRRGVRAVVDVFWRTCACQSLLQCTDQAGVVGPLRE